MADTKLSALTGSLAKSDFAAGDLCYVVDISEVVAADKSKKTTLANILGDGTSILITSSGVGTIQFAGVWTVNKAAIGATSTSGLIVANSTAAAAGAEQFSPGVELLANGWKTNATAGSQICQWRIDNQPVQGAAAPTTTLVFASQINAGGYTTVATLNSTGQILATDGAQATPAFAFAADPDTGFHRGGSGDIRVDCNNTAVARILTSIWGIGSSIPLGWWDSGVGGATTAFVSPAAKVITSNGGSSPAWLQNTAGLSRVKDADVTTVSVTPAAITGLTFTTLAGRAYSGELVLYLDDATAADGIRVDFDGGAGTWTSWIAQGIVSDTVSNRTLARTTAIATDLVDTVTTGSAIVIIKFSGVANAAGTCIPRLAKSTDAAGATLTCRIGSYMKLDDMP